MVGSRSWAAREEAIMKKYRPNGNTVPTSAGDLATDRPRSATSQKKLRSIGELSDAFLYCGGEKKLRIIGCKAPLA